MGTEPRQSRGTLIAQHLPATEKPDALAAASRMLGANFTLLSDDDYARQPVDPCVYCIGGWRMNGNPLTEWMKPSNAKIIVWFKQPQWCGMPSMLHTGPRVLQWLQQFTQIHQYVLLYSEQFVESGSEMVCRAAKPQQRYCKSRGIKKRAPRRPF